MRAPSIRTSLMLWFVTSTWVLLGAFSATLYFGIRSSLIDGVDSQLLARADGLAALCEWEDDTGEVELDAAEGAASAQLAAGPGRSVEIWTWPQAGMLFSSGAADRSPDPATVDVASLRRGPVYDTLLTDGREVRQCTGLTQVEPAAGSTAPGFSILVRVTEDLDGVSRQLARIRAFILVLSLLAFAVVLGFATLVSRRLVRPLAMLGEAASAAGAGDRKPMPDRGTGDEVDRLSRILESSFDALQAALERQARFTADAAHELRNPITTIRSAAEVAQRCDRGPEEYDAFLEDIQVTAAHMGDVVESLLMLARMDAGAARASFDRVALDDVVRDVVGGLPQEARDRVVLDARPSCALGDGRLLRVLVENVVSNALRHSGADTAVEIRAWSGGGEAGISVRDRGPGIPDEERSRVFERFYRVERARPNEGGAGLGLSIVAAVTRLHGGSLECSPMRPGTEFTVRFPSATRFPRSTEREVFAK